MLQRCVRICQSYLLNSLVRLLLDAVQKWSCSTTHVSYKGYVVDCLNDSCTRVVMKTVWFY